MSGGRIDRDARVSIQSVDGFGKRRAETISGQPVGLDVKLQVSLQGADQYGIRTVDLLGVGQLTADSTTTFADSTLISADTTLSEV